MNKGRIPQTFIDEVLTRTDIIEIIENRIKLKKTGSNYSGLCPFHNEKSPSFTVSPTKQFFYCFGCGAHGNAISFLMQYERLEFIDVIESMATKAGLEIPRDDNNTTQQQSFSDLYSLLTNAAKFYQAQLRKADDAVNYLKGRGLSGEIAKKFGIGYAPSGWDHLSQQYQNNPKAIEFLVTSGMAIKKSSEKIYDRFRARIMFPIRDVRGRVIAFGGRTLGDEQPKYLNSPETPIYHKGAELYGLYEARQAHTKLDKIMIVEGYMDVVALAQFGITYAVATLGTATSAKHLQRLFRYTSEIIFCFDGDNAGRQAAWRALEVALPFMNDGVQAKFMFLPEGEDPDTLIRKQGQTGFENYIAQALALSDFFFHHLSEQTDLKTADGKARFAKLSTDLLYKIPTGIFQQLMFSKLAEIIGIDPELLQNTSTATTDEKPAEKSTATKKPSKSRAQSPVALAISLLIQHPYLASPVNEKTINNLSQIDTPRYNVLIQLINLLKQNPSLTTGAILEHWRNTKYVEQLAKLAMHQHPIPESGLQLEFQDTIARIENMVIEQKIQTLLDKAKQSQLNADEKIELQRLIGLKNNQQTVDQNI